MDKEQRIKSLWRSLFKKFLVGESVYLLTILLIYLSFRISTSRDIDSEKFESLMALIFIGSLWILLLSFATLTSFFNLIIGVRTNAAKRMIAVFGLPILIIAIPLIVMGESAFYFDKTLVHFWIPTLIFLAVTFLDYLTSTAQGSK
jgi:hypothetical protein